MRQGDAAVLYGGEAEEAVDRPGDSDAWTDAQELALVKALKVFGKDLGQER